MTEIYNGIEYMGNEGSSESCKQAVMQILQFGRSVCKVRILSCSNAHCLLLTVEYGDLIAIRAGFTSGYGGEGPHTFSYTLRLLNLHGIDIEEYIISKDFYIRVNEGAITTQDIESLDKMRPVRPGYYWCDYMKYHNSDNPSALWKEFPSIIPFAVIDYRLSDLALKFHINPDECLLSGYRRLEDSLRERTNLTDHGAKLFSKCFLDENPWLTWEGLPKGECKGRGNLFTSAFMAFRNPRAHKESTHSSQAYLMEFLLLNQLFSLENEAALVERPDIDEKKHNNQMQQSADLDR